ncbi:MAG: hypothetical protein Q4P84_06935 [Elusimicrobiales bacterium]|nr:hypothetical protein [Elusimicrobiales bacterium]
MNYDEREERFYDRTEERKSIPKQIRKNEGQQQVIILFGTTGVGKSTLAEKLLRDELADYKSVIVRIGKSSDSTIESLSYFNALYRELAEVAKKRKDYRLKTPGQYGRRNPLNWLRILFSAVMNYLNIDKHIAEPIEEYSVSRKKEFILSMLKKGPFIVNVQNIHNIDVQSTELLQSISKDVPNLVWMVEYTIPAEGMDNQFYAFINDWQRIAPCLLYEISKLDFDLAFNLAPPEVKNSEQRKRIEAQYEKSHGNLLTIMVVPKNLDENGNYMRSKLNSLSSDEKYIVYLLYLNESPMLESVLYSILAKIDEQTMWVSFSQSKADTLLKKLAADKIILKRNGTYSIKHDSLCVIISQLPATPLLFLAFRALESHYRTIAERGGGNQEEYINHLFSLYVRFHDESLIDLFPKICDLIYAAKYPKEILEKLEVYKKHVLQNSGADIHILYPVARFLTELCIRLQYPDEAMENLKLIYDVRPSQYLVGLQGAICALRSSEANWDKVNSLIECAEENSRLKLSLCLCRLRIMMRSCDSNKSKAYAEEILSCPAYRDFPEYGFLIHNYAEFSETPEEALNYYRQARDTFKKYGMVNMQAQVNISMSMGYSYAGQLKNARRALQRAEKLAPKQIPETVLLNDSAVIDILDGKVSPAVLNKLADAALMNINPYEVLIIKSNWLTGLTLSNRMDQAADLAVEIEQSGYESYQYEDFLHIVYQDLHFYYTQVGNAEKADFYRGKLVALSAREGINEGTRTLIQLMLEKKQEQKVFYSRFPFRVDFLGFWGLVISPDLENFQ